MTTIHEHLDRRAVLTKAGVASAAILASGVALGATAPRAEAADTDPLLLGVGNAASSMTSLTSSGPGLSVTSTSTTAAYAIQARRNSASTNDPALAATTNGSGPAILATVTGSGLGDQVQPAIKAVHAGAGGGLWAEREGTNNAGIPAITALDHGTRGAIEATSAGIAVRAEGTRAALLLEPVAAPTPTTGTHEVGEMRMGPGGEVLVCSVPGTPGRWRRLVAAAPFYDNGLPGAYGWAGSMNLMPTPFRMFDSRPGQPPPQGGEGKLEPATDEVIQIAALGAPGNGGHVVATGSVGVVCTITVTETEGSGYVKAFPTGVTPPNTSVLNWFASGQTFATTTIVRLDTEGRMTVRLGSNRSHVLVDIIGFVI